MYLPESNRLECTFKPKKSRPVPNFTKLQNEFQIQLDKKR